MKYPQLWGGCVNGEHEDSIRYDLIEEVDTEVHDKVREISIYTENEDVIYRYVTKNETEKYGYL